MPREEVIAELKAVGAEAFDAEMQASAAAVEGVGTASEVAAGKTEEAAAVTAKSSKKAHSSIIKWAAAGIALAKGYSFIKGAVKDTLSLAKATSGLQRTTGMDAKTASAWASVAKERNVNTMQMQRSFSALGKVVISANQGTDKARQKYAALNQQYKALAGQPTKNAKELSKQVTQLDKLKQKMVAAKANIGPTAALFKKLGLSTQELNKGNTEQRIEAVAQALTRIKDPIQRAAIGQKVFGRQYMTLGSILGKGKKGIQDMQTEMRKSGAVLSGPQVKSAMKAIKAQRDLDRTMDGLKITIATTLLPVISSLSSSLSGLLQTMQPLFKLMQKYPGVTAAIAGAIIGVVTAFKLANWAVETFNLTVEANPIALVIIAIAALVIGFIVLYKKVGWFRAGVNAAWGAIKTAFLFLFNFVKDHWQLLLAILGGPIGIIAGQIISHFGDIKSAAHDLWKGVTAVFNAIKTVITDVWGVIGPIVGKIGGAIGAISSGISKIPGISHLFGTGGIMPTTGMALVGEYGPEVVTLPAGARVDPLTGPGASDPVDLLGLIGGALNVRSQLIVDRRVLAESVGRAVADREARR